MNKIIDTNYSFTDDTPGFWKGYWDDEMGHSLVDPDLHSKTLKKYHKLVWSKKLPNGEYFDLTEIKSNYLTWKQFRLSSDNITASFRYEKYRYMIKKVIDYLPNYNLFMENYTKKAYTIGGSIIFPKKYGGINQSRGCNPFIRDRFDLTLECIRLYYNGQQNPMQKVLCENKEFFDLFVNFKGYVDFFYLQDLVSEDYTSVKFLLENGEFKLNPFPKTVEEYLTWINKQIEFVEKRNSRIDKALINR